jgi:hypothetical protein
LAKSSQMASSPPASKAAWMAGRMILARSINLRKRRKCGDLSNFF